MSQLPLSPDVATKVHANPIEGTQTSTIFLRVGQAATELFGASTKSTRVRVRRMIDRGELAAIRIGARGDRLIPAREVARLLAQADANRVGVAATGTTAAR